MSDTYYINEHTFHFFNMEAPLLITVLSLILIYQFQISISLSNLITSSFLSVEDPDDVLSSPNNIFSAGFYPVGDNAYCFAIWFNDPSCIGNCTIVWMANRDYPVNGKYSKLSLLESGNLVLTDAGRLIVWSTKTSLISTTHLSLFDNGNLVLRDFKGVVFWQSFDYPTDTLLPDQPLTKFTELVSSRSRSNHSSGFYKLYFDDDNVLRLLYNGPKTASIFWPKPWLLSSDAGRTAYNDSRIAVLDSFGYLVSSDNFTFFSSDYGTQLLRRLTIDFDGNLRLYSPGEVKRTWFVTWQAMPKPCMIHGTCGSNSICVYSPNSDRKCICMPGNQMVDRLDWSLGCKPKHKNVLCNANEVEFVFLPHVEIFGYEYKFYVNFTEESCKKECTKSCECKGYQVRYAKRYYPTGVPYCYLKSQLLNGQLTSSYSGAFYMKVLKGSFLSSMELSNKDYKLDYSQRGIIQLDRSYRKSQENQSVKFLLWAVGTIGIIEVVSVLFVWAFLLRNQKKSDNGYHLATTGIRKFTYAELKEATKGFHEEIGRGAGGIVYKGVLSDDRVAAVKRLKDTNRGEAEFLAEVNTIGSLNHMNLIEMWGYCAEGKHRLLVYKHMKHGSLADNLSSNSLSCETRYEIAVGTAKCLAYLHEECLEWVLHCDVKPENILLDSEYEAKVSDFGLSRLQSRVDHKNSNFSKVRGTRGYMAPEWLSNQQITSKVDVYSYGIVLLEMVTGTRLNSTIDEETRTRVGSEKGDLVSWMRERILSEDLSSWMEEIIDPSLIGKYDEYLMETMMLVALKCVEKDKDERPTMSKVVEMLLRHENSSSEIN